MSYSGWARIFCFRTLIAAANGRDGGFPDGKAEGFEANSAAPKNRAFADLGVGEVRYR